MQSSQYGIVGSLCTVLAVAAVGTRAAAGPVYTLDTVDAGTFTITSGSRGDLESHMQTWHLPVSLDEHFFADSFAGSGWTTAESNLLYSTTESTIMASGSISNYIVMGDAHEFSCQTESFVEVRFSVTVPTLFQLDAATSLALNPASGAGGHTIIAHVFQYNWGGGASGFSGSSGLLSPGQYRLSAQVKLLYDVVEAFRIPIVDSQASFNYELTLTPVPTPGSLMALSVLGLGGTRRRQ